MAIGEWSVETGGTLGQGGEFTPVQYPRSGDDRDISTQFKGAASLSDSIDNAVATNTDGNTSVPRHADTPIDYEAEDSSGAEGKGVDD